MNETINHNYFNANDEKLIWEEMKKIIRKEPEEYENIIENREIISLLKEVYTSAEKVSPEVMRAIWVKTNKQSSKLWKHIRSNLYKETPAYTEYKQERDVKKKCEIEEAVKALGSFGVYKLKASISQHKIQLIQEQLNNQYVIPSDCNQRMVKEKSQMVKELYKKQDEEYIRWHFNSSIFNEIDEIREVCNMDTIKQIAEVYLGAPPFQFNSNAWISKGLKQMNRANYQEQHNITIMTTIALTF